VASPGQVELRGEVRFPGTYPIEAGERLSSVIARAGGLTEHAFVEGSVFLREDLRRREREQIERLVNRLEADLANMAMQASRAAAVQGARADQSVAVGQALLSQLRRAAADGPAGDRFTGRAARRRCPRRGASQWRPARQFRSAARK
jgi:polysaccharide biosynthesis/export protein